MIVKMIILKLLGSSDDKREREDRRSKARRSVAPEEPMPRASVHPMVVGRTDAMDFWCRRESKPSQPIGTG